MGGVRNVICSKCWRRWCWIHSICSCVCAPQKKRLWQEFVGVQLLSGISLVLTTLFSMLSRGLQTPVTYLDCYWVGSLNQGVFY